MSNYQSEGCDCCGQFPYISSSGMCPVCTFGEAEAMQDAMDGNMGGLVWEREKQEKPQYMKSPKRVVSRKAVEILTKFGFYFKVYNNDCQINISTKSGLVVYYPTTRRVSHGGKSQKLNHINKSHDGDIVNYLQELSK